MLELVAESTNGISNADLSRRLKIPKSSASYILRVLEQRGYLNRDADGRYRLGLKLMSIASDAITGLDVREIAKPALRKFLRKSRLPGVHLAVLDNGRAVYVEKLEAEKSFIKMDIWVGHRLPVHTTAIGKVLVAGLDDEEIKQILRARGMEKRTRNSITTQKRFFKDIAKVREFGFAMDNEENSSGVRCIAAPVYDSEGKVIAALGTSSTILDINDETAPEIVEMVKDTASEVSKLMGFKKKVKTI